MMKKGVRRPLGSVLDTSMWRGQYKWSQRPEHGMSPQTLDRGMPGNPPAMRHGSKPLYFPQDNVTFEVYDPFTSGSTRTSTTTSINKDTAIYSASSPLTSQNPNVDLASLQRAQSEFTHLHGAPSSSSPSPDGAEQPPLEATKPTTLARAHPPTTVMDIKYQDVQPKSTSVTTESTSTATTKQKQKQAPFSLGFDREPVSDAEKAHAARIEQAKKEAEEKAAKEARARGEETLTSTQVDTTVTTRKVVTEQHHANAPAKQNAEPLPDAFPKKAGKLEAPFEKQGKKTHVAKYSSSKRKQKKQPKKQVPKAQSKAPASEKTSEKTTVEKQVKQKSTVNVVVVPTQEDFGVLEAKPLRDPFPQDQLEAAFPETESKPHIVKYIAPISAKEPEAKPAQEPKPAKEAEPARWYQTWLGIGKKAVRKEAVEEAKAPAPAAKEAKTPTPVAKEAKTPAPVEKSTVNVVVVPTQEDFGELMAKPLRDAFPENTLEAAFPETEWKPHVAKYIAPEAKLPAPFAPRDERVHVAKYSSPKPKAAAAETETETLTTTKVVKTTETEVSKAEAKKADAEPQKSTWRQMIFGKPKPTKAAEPVQKAPEPVKKAATPPPPPPPKAAPASAAPAPKGTSPSQWEVTPGSYVPPKPAQAAGPSGAKPDEHTGKNILDELYGGPRSKVPYQAPVESKPPQQPAKARGWEPVAGIHPVTALGENSETPTKTVVKTTKTVETFIDPLKKVTPHPRKDAATGMPTPAAKDASDVHAKSTDLSRKTVEKMVSQATKGQVPDSAVVNLAPQGQKRDSKPLTYEAYEELKRNYDALQKKRDTELAELRRLYSMLLAQNGAQQAGVAPEKYAGAKQRAEASESELLSAHDKFETFLQQHTRLEKEYSELVTEKAKLAEALAAAQANGEVSSGARDAEIRALRERIEDLKKKSVSNPDRVHVMPKVTVIEKNQQQQSSADPQLKSLKAENKQLRSQLQKAASAPPPPPPPAAGAAQPAAKEQQAQVEALKSRLSNTMEERDSALRKVRRAAKDGAPVTAEESNVYVERIRQLESRLNEQKPVLPKSAPIYAAKQQPAPTSAAAPAADASSVHVERIRQLEKRLNEFEPAQPKPSPVIVRDAPTAAAPASSTPRPDDSSVFVQRIRQLEKRLNEFEPVQQKPAPIAIQRAPAAPTSAADSSTAENILTQRIRQLEHRLNEAKRSEKPRVVVPVQKAAAAAAPEVSELKKANEDLQRQVAFLKNNVADQTKSRSPLSVVRNIFGGKEQELTEVEKNTLTQKTVHVEKTHDDPRVPKLESNVANLSAENIRLKTEKAVLFEKLNRLESRQVQAQLPKGAVPAGAQPHKAQPSTQDDADLKRRVVELEHEKRALADKHAKVVNDNRMLNGELRHVQQETAKLAAAPAPAAQEPSPQAKKAMEALRDEKERLHKENLELQEALTKAREAPAASQASPAAKAETETEVTRHTTVTTATTTSSTPQAQEDAAAAAAASYDPQVPELLKKIVALEHQLKDAQKEQSATADQAQASEGTETEEIKKKISALESEKAELAAANEAARAEKEELARALKQAQAQPVTPIVVKTTTAPRASSSPVVVTPAPTQASPAAAADQQRIADLERERATLADKAERAEAEAAKLAEALKAAESKPAPVLQAGNTDQLKQETEALRGELSQLAKEKAKLKQMLEDAKVQNSRTRTETESKIQSANALVKQQRAQTQLLEGELERLQGELNAKQTNEAEVADRSQQLLNDLEALLAQRKQSSASTSGFKSAVSSSGSSSSSSELSTEASSDASSSSSKKSFAQRAAAIDPKYLDQVAWVAESQSRDEWEVYEPTNLDKDGPAKF